MELSNDCFQAGHRSNGHSAPLERRVRRAKIFPARFFVLLTGSPAGLATRCRSMSLVIAGLVGSDAEGGTLEGRTVARVVLISAECGEGLGHDAEFGDVGIVATFTVAQ